jgi:hypothetical protein
MAPHFGSSASLCRERIPVPHVHTGGIVDIPFPRTIRDALLTEGLAEVHPWVPDSGWVSFRIGRGSGFEGALWLLRLSYVRYALKTDENPKRLFDQECEKLRLSPRLVSLLAQFISTPTSSALTEPLSIQYGSR